MNIWNIIVFELLPERNHQTDKTLERKERFLPSTLELSLIFWLVDSFVLKDTDIASVNFFYVSESVHYSHN
jgi:hypothetical protein